MRHVSTFVRRILMLLILIAQLEANQVVLITGASRGIGLATAKLLAKEGYVVYAAIRNSSSKEAVEKAASQFNKNFNIIELDVTDQRSIDLGVQEVLRKEGHIDVLVNNAGIMVYGFLENVTIEEAQKVFDVNFFGTLRVTQAVLPLMREQKRGRIIQISSRSGFRPLPSISIYAASKFALEGLSETMGALLKPWNIYVSLIEPGPVRTDLDYISPYGSRLLRCLDPYYLIFEKSGLLDPDSPIAQEPEEIAYAVKKAIEDEKPLFRYQTTENIKKQAALRFVDITGNSSISEWEPILFPNSASK